MRIALDIPDELAPNLAPSGQDPARVALRPLLSRRSADAALRLSSCATCWGFLRASSLTDSLKAHQIEKYTASDFDDDLATLNDLDNSGRVKRPA